MAFLSASSGGDKDIELLGPPSDSISSVSFSKRNHLAVGSWDNTIRFYGVDESSSPPKIGGVFLHSHPGGPVLSTCWNSDGSSAFFGAADNTAHMIDVSTTPPTTTQVAQHDAPIRIVKYYDTQGSILVTGSWDKTVKLWDLRQRPNAANLQLPERCYTLDLIGDTLVVGTAERHILMFNIRNSATPFKEITSPLKWQTRVVSCYTVSQNPGFAVGSVEGRVAIQYIEDSDSPQNFSFKCHRRDAGVAKDQVVYAVNDISFHPVHGTFSTCGSDGTIHFWDKDARTRLKSFEAVGGPISCTAFNPGGNLFAYAVSYDWSKGHAGMVPSVPNKLMVHVCKDEEVRKRPRK